MANWASLPTEIRNMIMDLVLLSGNARGKMAAYTTVSREWQAYFEPQNFHRLVLNHSCVADFDKITRNRKWMVKHIWLRVVLPRYSCFTCDNFETFVQTRRNNRMFTNALWQLLEILASWGDRRVYDPVNGTGPVLELSAHSPSDLRHEFEGCTLDKDIYPHRFDEKCTYEEYKAQLWRKLEKDQFRGNHCYNIDRKHLRMFGEIALDFSTIKDVQRRKLPTIDAVKGLLIRRQHYRGLSPQTVAEITGSFRTIDNVTFEPILRKYRTDTSPEHKYEDLVREAYRFKSLSILIGYHFTRFSPWAFWSPSRSLSWMLADESHSLEHLSVAFAVDAMMFFQDFLQPGSQNFLPYLDPSRSGVQRALLASLSPDQRLDLNRSCSPEKFERALLTAAGYENAPIPRSVYKPQWPKLKTLALGSAFRALRPAEDLKARASDLFEGAGFAALEMPELQIMEIWDQTKDHHQLFQYRRIDTKANGYPTITLGATWDVTLEPRVSIAWDRVAQKHSNRGIVIKIQGQLERDKHPYSLIKHLELCRRIAHPISLCELRRREKRSRQVAV